MYLRDPESSGGRLLLQGLWVFKQGFIVMRGFGSLSC